MQHLRRVSQAHATKSPNIAMRMQNQRYAGGRKRLTDAFTKLLTPGTTIRDMSAWVININRLLSMESF
jgi:hypothetical protein